MPAPRVIARQNNRVQNRLGIARFHFLSGSINRVTVERRNILPQLHTPLDACQHRRFNRRRIIIQLVKRRSRQSKRRLRVARDAKRPMILLRAIPILPPHFAAVEILRCRLPVPALCHRGRPIGAASHTCRSQHCRHKDKNEGSRGHGRASRNAAFAEEGKKNFLKHTVVLARQPQRRRSVLKRQRPRSEHPVPAQSIPAPVLHRPALYAQKMVRFTVLASGSKGNCTVVSGGPTRILVDAGLSCRELFKRMKAAGEDPATLDAIIITHEHQDHVNGLGVTARKLGIPVYFTEGTHRAWMRWLTPRRQMTYKQWLEQCRQQAASRQAESEPSEGEPDDLEIAAETNCEAESSAPPPEKDPTFLPSVQYFQAGRPLQIGDFLVSPFTIPHDAVDPVGFVFQAEGVRMAVATDLGYVTPNVKAQLKQLDLLLLESNHDLEMLRDGPYPWSVKQRVLSRVGHLSNEAAAQFLESEYDGQATYVILGHLSESNNLPELARVTAERALNGRASLLANRLLLAAQREPMLPVCF